MEILLHVGAHRCASTTFQRTLGANREPLQSAGLRYWGPKMLRAGLFRGLYGDDDLILPWQRGRAEGRVALRLHDAERAGAAALIISEENMLGTMRANLDTLRLYPDAGERVARFARAFSGHPLSIGLSIRSYDAWWRSVLAFRLIRGGPVPTRALCDKLVTQPRRWRHVVSEIAEAVPAAHLKVWTHECLADRPGDALAILLGQRVGLRGGVERHNASPSIGQIRAYISSCGQEASSAGRSTRRFEPFCEAQRAAMREQYADDVAWLTMGAGGLAQYIDDAGAQIPDCTGHTRGRPDDRELGDMARTG